MSKRIRKLLSKVTKSIWQVAIVKATTSELDELAKSVEEIQHAIKVAREVRHRG